MSARFKHFTQTELDTEYSPSSCIDDMSVFLQQYSDVSREVRENGHYAAKRYLDLSYGEKVTNRLDLFMPKIDQQKPPLHIYIHGGYWQQLDKSDSSFLADNFNQAGAAVAVINYTLAPAATMKEIVEEVALSIVWLYQQAKNYGYDQERVYLSGSSAGAHLASMMLYQSWSDLGLPNNIIKGLCAVSGIYDLTPISMTYVNDPLQLGEQDIAKYSPLLNAPKNVCPVIVAYGENETSEFKRHSQEFNNYLLRHRFNVDFFEIANTNHFDVILDLVNNQSLLCQRAFKQMNLTALFETEYQE